MTIAVVAAVVHYSYYYYYCCQIHHSSIFVPFFRYLEHLASLQSDFFIDG